DQWGGRLENRLRFGSRIMEGIRTACGNDFIIGLAISYGNAHSPDLSLEEKVAIVAYHDHARHMDYVTCGSGGYLGFDKLMPTFVFEEKIGLPLAAAVKQAVNHALVTCESHVRTPENADYIIASEDADLVSIVRGQIADPQLISKTQTQREQDIRGCISCNQMCWGRRSRDYWISCLVNPRVGREHDWHIQTSNTPKKIIIIGAGPAGLECARVLAERGHHVSIYEATPDLGGQFRLAGLAPRRGQILELLGWYQSQLQALKVTINYNSYMDADDLGQLQADEIILATGSMPDPTASQRWLWLAGNQALPGLDNKVYSAEDVLRKQAKLGHRLILLDEGGNWRGLGTALYLAQQGHQLTIVTPDPYVGKELTRTSADLPLRSQLKQLGTVFLVESVISQWQSSTATITSLLDHQQTQVEASAIVVATTNRAFNELELELTEGGISCHTIGDCVAPRQAMQAIYEGHKLGLEL
nr:FAD-dependent oxidoreductase [Oceanospirillaceae bacterium]